MLPAGQLLDATGTDAEAQLELRGQEELGAQRQQERVFERVGDRLKLVPNRGVGSKVSP